jgi:hypothetical protein
MDELNKLIDQYIKLHPNATNPLDWLWIAGVEYLIDILKNSNGRELIYVLANEFIFDGGYISYMEN